MLVLFPSIFYKAHPSPACYDGKTEHMLKKQYIIMVLNRNNVIDFFKNRSMFLFLDYLKDIDSLNQ